MSTLPTPQIPDAAHFAAPVCHNCGAELTTPFCGRCGQKRAHRLNLGAVRAEAWQNYRVFEFGIVKAAWRLAHSPGHIAREFVLGARAKHVHPLKLLLIAIGVLMMVLVTVQHLTASATEYNAVMQRVQAYANWSMTLGFFAIVIASMAVLSWRRPYNLTEHMVLGLYAHFLVIAANVLSFLPLIVYKNPGFVMAHRIWSAWPMEVIETSLVLFAFHQFFQLRWRRDWWRLLLAGLVYAVVKWGINRLFVLAVIEYVFYTLPKTP